MTDRKSRGDEPRWILLIHQIPPRPSYLRVKIWRQLQKLGAIAVKNSVYVLPLSARAQEDFQWVLRQIKEGGGDGSIVDARFVDGLSDEQVKGSFLGARDHEYREIAAEARKIAERRARGKAMRDGVRAEAKAALARLRRRFDETVAIDFFGAAARETAAAAFVALEERLRGPDAAKEAPSARVTAADYQGRTWVTRSEIHIDRMASAWLIRRFIDRRARFKFVQAKGYRPTEGEGRFDMFEAEFTHEGDRCTFEVLVRRFGLGDRGLARLAEIVHDIDVRDDKYERPEAPGLALVASSIAEANQTDEDRLEAAAQLLNGIHAHLASARD